MMENESREANGAPAKRIKLEDDDEEEEMNSRSPRRRLNTDGIDTKSRMAY